MQPSRRALLSSGNRTQANSASSSKWPHDLLQHSLAISVIRAKDGDDLHYSPSVPTLHD